VRRAATAVPVRGMSIDRSLFLKPRSVDAGQSLMSTIAILRENSLNISQMLKSIIDGIAVTSKQSSDTRDRITEMSKEIDDFAETMTELITTFGELSAYSGEIISVMDSLKSQSDMVKIGYGEILS
jgi:methyl-accepting chemotaxis protein